MTTPPTESAAPGSGGGLVTATSLWRPVRRHRGIVVWCLLLVLVAAAAYVLLRPAAYTAKASVQLGVGVVGVTDVGVSRQTTLTQQTEAQVAQSVSVAVLAARSLPGPVDVEDLLDELVIGTPVDSSTIDIAFTADTAEGARAGAQAFADAYVAYRTDELRQSVPQRPDLVVHGGTVISAAQLPKEMSSLPVWVVLAAAVVAGLLVGWTAAVLRSRVDDRIRDADEVAASGLPALGMLDGTEASLVAVTNRLLLGLDEVGAGSVLVAEAAPPARPVTPLLVGALHRTGVRTAPVTRHLVLDRTAVVTRDRVSEAIKAARTSDELVVVVSGPLVGTPAAVVAATAADAVVMSVLRGRTSLHAVRAVADDVAAHGGRVVGVVVVEPGERHSEPPARTAESP
jgi:capsular polysaccharide biosynthesis protein